MNNKILKVVLLIVEAILIIGMIVATVVTIDEYNLAGICNLISLVCVGAYVFFLYRLPHGNILKYAILIFSLAMIIQALNGISGGNEVFHEGMRIISAGALCYAAGRLDRIKQNAVIFSVVEALLVAHFFLWNMYPYMVFSQIAPEFIVRLASNFVLFAILVISYFVRYKEHKEAGLLDK